MLCLWIPVVTLPIYWKEDPRLPMVIRAFSSICGHEFFPKITKWPKKSFIITTHADQDIFPKDNPPSPQQRKKVIQQINSLQTMGRYSHKLMTYANSLDPDQAPHCVGPDLDTNYLLTSFFPICFKKTMYNLLISIPIGQF